MAVRFGTDGVRGHALTELTPEGVLLLGRACARVLGVQRVIVGRDPRRSGHVFEAALAAGLAAEGIEVDLVGVLPTPGVAWLAYREQVAAAMITASHNPWTDNGVKVFAVGGRKLDDAQQLAVERLCAEPVEVVSAASEAVGTIRHRTDAADRYEAAIADAVGLGALRGLHIVVDAANGAMGGVAGRVLERLGARVSLHFASQAGDDVNQGCGAAHPEALSALVPALGADLGLAFDGDGDRVIAVDHTGSVVDGDRLIALTAWDRQRRGALPGNQVVVTVMTNLGFHRAMQAHGISVATTPVGDRHVMDAMEASGAVLGGEQSGHIIHRDLMPSGDGLLSGALVADLVRREGRPLADLAAGIMTAFPQVLVNVSVAPGTAHEVARVLADEVAEVERRLGDTGRVLVRPSGTEPLLRIMVEAPNTSEATELADHLAQRAGRLGGCAPGPDTAG